MLLTPARHAAAESLECSIVTDDFVTRQVRIVRIDERSLECLDIKSGKSATIALEHVVRWEKFAKIAKPSANAAFILKLRDHQRWLGSPGKMEGDDLKWNAFTGAERDATVTVPLKSVVGIVAVSASASGEQSTASAAATQDELMLANGDVLSGVISASDGATVTCATRDGPPISVEWANVRSARFAELGSRSGVVKLAPFRLTLRDGRVIDGERMQFVDGRLSFESAMLGTIELVNGETVIAIDHRGGRVTMLTDVAPLRQSQVPYFPSRTLTQPVRTTSIAIGGTGFRCAFHMRPRGEMTWTLDGNAGTFCARYAIPEGRPAADAIVRVLLDGNVVLEKLHVCGGIISELVRVPLGSAKEITLEVDFGDTFDVGDDVYWIDPALVAK